MRVALISDLHGNSIALDAVLADAKRAGADVVACLGDCATLGPDPDGTFDRLRALPGPKILGNHDAFLLDPDLIRSYTEAPIVVESVDWARERLTEQDAAFVRGFTDGETLDLGGGATLRLFHGTPRSHMEELLATTPAEQVDEMLDGATATVLAGGHTHLQMLRQHRGLLLVNPGSVGQPFREFAHRGPPVILAHAEYALVTGTNGGVSVELKRVALDRRALYDAAMASEVPIRHNLAAHYA
jgi:predicted phosphodiesterase